MRNLFLKLFLGGLSLTALIGVALLLTGGFGTLQAKILGTTFCISAFSICAMGCAAWSERNPSGRLGHLGILLSTSAAAMLITGMWTETDSFSYWKIALALTTLGIGITHNLVLQLPKLDARHIWSQRAATWMIAVLSLQILLAIFGEIDAEAYYRVLAAVSVGVAVLSLTVPVLSRFRSQTNAGAQRLHLKQVHGHTFVDSEGRRYSVIEQNP